MTKDILQRSGVLIICCAFLIALLIPWNMDSKEGSYTLIRHIPEKVSPDTSVSKIIEVSGTVYNPVVGQCDGSPLHTADGSFIDTILLRQGEIRWLAISQDLLVNNGGPYKLGDTIYVHHPNPKIRGQWVIHDCMNPRVKRYLDFLQPVGSTDIGNATNILISKEKFYD